MLRVVSRSDEIERLLKAYPDWGRLIDQLSLQMNVLHNRAQVLLTLSGVVVTVTGFSGRLIAGTSRPAQALIVVGLVVVLAAAGVCVFKVLPVRWLSQQPGGEPREWLGSVLAYRDDKTRAYRWAMGLLLLGLTVYVASIALMLLNPTPMDLPVR